MKLPSATSLGGYFANLARYHAWATRSLLDHVDRLPEVDYRREVGLFFRSVHGTCNHLLVAEDVAWHSRFASGVSPAGVDLGAELESDRTAVRRRLIDVADRWAVLVPTFDDRRYTGMLDYTTTRGVAQSLPFAPTLGHVFNHATHHRGQITAAITAMGYPCPEIDWVWMLQAESRATA